MGLVWVERLLDDARNRGSKPVRVPHRRHRRGRRVRAARPAPDRRRRPPPHFLYGPYLLRGLVEIVLAATRSFGLAVGALAVYGVGTSTGNVTYNSVLQTTVPGRLRGRVFAFYDVIWQAARLASIGVGGILDDTFGVVAVSWAGGLLLLAAGVRGLTAGRTVDISVQGSPGPVGTARLR